MAIDYSPPSPKSDSTADETKMNQASQQKEATKNETPEKVFYKTKKIEFRGRTKNIILQDKNGPCPLIAICNVLILRDEINLDLDSFEVSQESLLTHVAEILFDRNDEEECIDVELLRGLAAGIFVDIKFESIKDFEVTPELALFDSLNIPLYHGWIVHPQDLEIATAIGGRSYNALTIGLAALETQTVKARSSQSTGEYFVDFGASITATSQRCSKTISFADSPPASAEHGRLLKALTLSEREAPAFDTHRDSNEGEAVSESSDVTGLTREEGEVIKTFLKDNASQLTWHGLFTLEDELKKDELCVLFRNNHFSTMLKHDDKLFTLVTDQGYLMEQDLVWERLNQINGDSVFITGNFKIFKSDSGKSRKWDQQHAINKTENVISGINSEDMDVNDPDLQMAKELQRQVWAGDTGSEVPIISSSHISSSLQELKEVLRGEDVQSCI